LPVVVPVRGGMTRMGMMNGWFKYQLDIPAKWPHISIVIELDRE